jgi:hypothetical protein
MSSETIARKIGVLLLGCVAVVVLARFDAPPGAKAAVLIMAFIGSAAIGRKPKP